MTGIARYLSTLWYSRRLRSRDCRIREAAVRGLATTGSTRLIDLLLPTLDDDDGVVVNSAINALGNSGDTRAAEALIHFLKRPERDRCCNHTGAIDALGKLGDKRAIDVLRGILGSEDASKRRAAASSLAELGELQWKTWIRGEDLDFRRLGLSNHPQAVDLLVSTLQNSHWANDRAQAVFGLLKCGGAQAYSHLIAALQDPDLVVRMAAADALGELGDNRATEHLIDVLDGDIRLNAAGALAKLGEPQWASWIRGESDDIDRLSASGDSRARAILFKMLTWSSPFRPGWGGSCRPLTEIDRNRIIGIFQKHETEWLPLLLDAFHQSNCNEPVLVEVLRSFTTQSAIEQIIASLSVLSQNAGTDYSHGSRVSHKVIEYVRSRARLDRFKDSSPTLLQSLQDEDFSIRARAARLLSQKGDPRCAELLLNIIARPTLEKIANDSRYVNRHFEPDSDMVTIVVEVLCSDCSPETRQCLERIVRHNHYRWHIESVDEKVTYALAKIGMPESVHAICERLRDAGLMRLHISDVKHAGWVMDITEARVKAIVRHLSALLECIRQKGMLSQHHYDEISSLGQRIEISWEGGILHDRGHDNDYETVIGGRSIELTSLYVAMGLDAK
ncbi:MAG: HEAT repeat domain-containing protein [Kiritimatiellae bacterium]|nr:HEAT repeat domain-containing protein [Kiritimatiellia bacterium]